jgi:hypothetical protein
VKKRPEPKWESEAAMLTAFADLMRACGFRVVPEHGGHDLLLVAGGAVAAPEGSYIHIPECIEPGDIIAVEGKLQGTVTMLRQCIPPDRFHTTPGRACADFHVAVVPAVSHDFRLVAGALGIRVWQMDPPGFRGWDMARLSHSPLADSDRILGFPRIVPTALDVAIVPGLPSPRALTPWKLAAVSLCMVGAVRDLTDADFHGTILRPRTFLEKGWLTRTRGAGRSAVYALGDAPGRPDRAYPEIVAAIAAQGGPTADPVLRVVRGPLFEAAS